MANWTLNFQSLLNLFLESQCPLCQRPTPQEFCQDCTRQLQRCKLSNHQEFWQGELPVFVWGNYSGTLKRAIAALKYDNQPQIAKPLGQWLAQAWLNSQPQQKLVVVPIPLHAAKLKIRGYNQAELLAESFCHFTGLGLQPQGLKRIKATDAQFSLSGSQREENLADAFVLGTEFHRQRPNNRVLLLDDIYTTGATVRSAVQALQKQGIAVYGVVAIATPSRNMLPKGKIK